jgi:hypothetical protein
MATVNKDFKIKSGLVVEGTTGTINGLDILTKKQADQDYIVGLIGGTATAENTPNTVVKRDANGDFAAGDITVNQLNIGSIGNIHDDGDLIIENTNGDDIVINGEDIRLNSADDFRVTADGAVVIESADHTRFVGGPVHIGFPITPENEVATKEYVDQAETDAVSTANSYADGLAVNYDAAGSAAAAQTAAQNYADGLIDDASNLSTEVWSAYKTSTEIGLAQAAAEQHADEAVAALVGSAPELLDTLQELATALDNDPDAINSLQSIAAGKQDALTAGANIDITGATISVTGLDSEDISDFNAAALSATSAAYDAAGAAATAEQNAIAHADALDTDDIAEGSAQYFTDARAKDSAVNLLVNSTQENIDISWTLAGGLVIAAENGVADSTTDDLAEGATNKYFSDSLALGAIEDANIQPSSIDITWVRREEATWTDVNTASKVTCHSAGTSEGSMKYLVRVTAQVGGVRHSHVTEVLATVAGDNGVAVVEYGTIYTSAEPLATVTVEWNAGTSAYDLNVTTANNNSEVMVAATLISALD